METKMTRGIYAFLDIALVGIFGMTMIDMLTIIFDGGQNLLTIDNGIKTLFSLAGLVYLIFVKIIGGIKEARLNRLIKQEELEKLERENNEAEKNQ